MATSGSYADLANKPTIPAAQVNSDWNASSGITQILNKPTLGTAAAQNTTAFAPASGSPNYAPAMTYYVDKRRGSDANSGHTPSTAIATIAHLLTLVPNTSASNGTSIFFKRGDVWREELLLPNVNAVHVGAYGAGVPPILDASDNITSSWSLASGASHTYATAHATTKHEASSNVDQIGAWDNAHAAGPLALRKLAPLWRGNVGAIGYVVGSFFSNADIVTASVASPAVFTTFAAGSGVSSLPVGTIVTHAGFSNSALNGVFTVSTSTTTGFTTTYTISGVSNTVAADTGGYTAFWEATATANSPSTTIATNSDFTSRSAATLATDMDATTTGTVTGSYSGTFTLSAANAAIRPGMVVTGTGIPFYVVVSSCTGTTLVLSQQISTVVSSAVWSFAYTGYHCYDGQTLYVKDYAGTAPSSSGTFTTYAGSFSGQISLASREQSIYLGDGAVVEDVQTERNMNNNGSLEVGLGSRVTRCSVYDGATTICSSAQAGWRTPSFLTRATRRISAPASAPRLSSTCPCCPRTRRRR